MTDTTGLQTASPAVVLEGVDAHLMAFIQYLALVHQVLFGSELVITSGKDSIHSAGSLHGVGRAVDVRIRDLDAEAQLLFISVISYAALSNKVAFFDERVLGVEAHVHIEYHGD